MKPASPPLRVVVGVGLVAGAVLAQQVLLTRLLAAAVFYHFAFFSISIALLGTGAAALVLYVRPGWFAGEAESLMARWSLVFAALLAIVPAALVRLDYGAGLYSTPRLVATVAVAGALSGLPFAAAGLVIAIAIRRYVATAGRVYAFDLAGAALGALLVVPLMWVAAVPTLLVALSVAAALAAALFGWSSRRLVAAALLAVVAAAGASGLAALTAAYRLPAPFTVVLNLPANSDRWTPISRVVGYVPPDPKRLLLTYDLDFAPVPRYRRGQPFRDWRFLGYSVFTVGSRSIPYALTGPGRTLVIGGGGGVDIHNALSSGQREVDVIELNRGIRDLVDRTYGAITGSPYSLPQVHTVIGDGRSTLAHRRTKYDHIEISGTNTFTASPGAAYALSENNLYTVEAVEEYLDHLRPGGILTISRPYHFSGEEALRATVLVLAALKSRGVPHPERHVVVVLEGGGRTPISGSVMARLTPFTPGEVARIRTLARQRTALGAEEGVPFAPGGPYRLEWAGLAAARSPDAFCAGHRVDVCAPTDDRPFFLNPTRLRDVAAPATARRTSLDRTPYVMLLGILGVLTILSLLAFVAPLLAVRDRPRPASSSLLFFAAIGLGFLLLEVVLIQRFVLFLGFPTYALSIVLFALLLSTGAGAWLSGRWRDPRRALVIALGCVTGLIALAAAGLQPLLRDLIFLPFGIRVVLSIALIAPLGIGLGAAMPIGLRRLAGLHPDAVAWAWAINGFTSVLASALAILISMSWGFAATTVAALACYALALAHAARGRWPDALPGGPLSPPPGT